MLQQILASVLIWISKELWDVYTEGGIPSQAIEPLGFKLSNGMSVKEALMELANLKAPKVEYVYGGNMVKITPTIIEEQD